MSQSIVVALPAQVDLAPAPIPADWILAGKPEARSKQLVRSRDGASSIMAWSCTAGRFNWRYTVDETVHIISGEVFITDETGEERRLGPGDMAFFPAGSRSIWRVPRQVRTLTGIFWPDEDAAGDPLAAQPAAGKVSSGLGDVRTKA